MNVQLGGWTGYVLAWMALFPLALAVAWVVAQARIDRGRMPGRAWGRSLAEVGIAYGTLPGVGLTLLPGSDVGASGGGVSLEPFADLPTMSTVQVVGNLLIFAALGLLGPLRFRWLASLPRVTLLAGACSTAIEVAQHELALGRVSSVDDILLNTAGAGLAALLSWPWWSRVVRRRLVPAA